MYIPKKMKAAILTELKKPLIVDEVLLPESLSVGQVLVKVHFSGICGSQIGEIEGIKGDDKYLPHLLGHEASGTVLETGPGVTHVKKGDLVVLHWKKGAGIEAVPAEYRWKGNKLNSGWVTTFNEYAIISENRVTKIEDECDIEVASLYGCAITTGFGVVENNAKLRLGESVVIFGAGGIGLNIVQAASLVSAYPIIAVDLYDNRLELAKKMGATHIINNNEIDPRKKILDIIGLKGVDSFIDNTGKPEIIELGYEITKSNGRITLVGVPKANNKIKIYSLPLHFGKTINGSHGGESRPEIDIPRYHKMFINGRLDFKSLITNYYSLDDINIAIQDMKSGVFAGRCLIKM